MEHSNIFIVSSSIPGSCHPFSSNQFNTILKQYLYLYVVIFAVFPWQHSRARQTHCWLAINLIKMWSTIKAADKNELGALGYWQLKPINTAVFYDCMNSIANIRKWENNRYIQSVNVSWQRSYWSTVINQFQIDVLVIYDTIANDRYRNCINWKLWFLFLLVLILKGNGTALCKVLCQVYTCNMGLSMTRRSIQVPRYMHRSKRNHS